MFSERAPIGCLRAAMAALFLVAPWPTAAVDDWSEQERRQIRSLWLGSLGPLPPSPGNAVADDPRAVNLGHRLFFDQRLSANAQVACASCHQPERYFKDGLARGQGMGKTERKTMTVVGSAYSPWQFWDGRRDSLWSQALAPLEHPAEHGGTRGQYARLIAEDRHYRRDYEALFGALPELSGPTRFPLAGPLGNTEERQAWAALTPDDQHHISTVFANIGRALEAYQRRLIPAPAPFDTFAEALLSGKPERAKTHLDAAQQLGLRLFIGKAQCVHCHNGPLFSNNEFHNTGLFGSKTLPTDRGRINGVRLLLADPFNCLGPFSPAAESDCGELRFVKTSGIELVAAFRTVSLRNIAGTGPFMHTGQFKTLRQVLEHYDQAQPTLISDDLKPLNLSEPEFVALEKFLQALSGPLATEPRLLRPWTPAN